MKFNKFISVFSICILCFFILGSNALIPEAARVGGKTGQKNQSSVVGSGSQSNSSSSTSKLNALKEGDEMNALQVLEELKAMTVDVSGKTKVNRNLILGSAVTNLALLLVISGLLGFSLRGKPAKEEKESGHKQNPSPEHTGEES